jgi:dihydroxyacetone kinase
MFEKRKRKKAYRAREKVAARRLHEAIATEWAKLGVVPRDSTGAAFRQAVKEAGLGGPGEPGCSRTAMKVVDDATKSLSEEDLYLVTRGREGRAPADLTTD